MSAEVFISYKPHAATRVCQFRFIRERRREHSRKPEKSYAIIEAMYPELPKIELFARQGRDGWACWGIEVKTA